MSKIEEILGRDINSIKELREEIKRLQDSIAGVDPETEQFKTTVEQLTAAQEQLASVTGRNISENAAAKDSIVGMEREYKNLYNTYKMLTEEQRNSGMGKQMAQDLAVMADKINNAKKEVGNFKNNIGNYTGSIINAFKQMGISIGGLASPLKTATAGMGGLNTVMKANPIGLVISAVMALISVIKSITGAIKQNEALQMRWNQAMAAFQPIIDGVKKALDGLAQIIVKIVEFAAQGFQKIQQLGAQIQDFFGKDKEHTKRLKEKQAVYNGLAKAENELTKNKREYMKLNSADEAEVERLREEISLTTDKAERQNLVNQAKEIQGRIDARNLEIAEEELRVAQERAKLTPNSAADNQKLAELEANVNKKRAEAAQHQRTLNRLMGRGSGGATSTMEDYKQKAKELYEELVKDSKDRITQLREEYDMQKKLLEKYGYDTTLLTKKYNKEVMRAQIETGNQRLSQQRSLYEKLYKAEDDYIATLPPEEAFQRYEKRLVERMESVSGSVADISILESFVPKDSNSFNRMIQEYVDEGMGEVDFSQGINLWYQALNDGAQSLIDKGIKIDFPPEFDEKNAEESIKNLNLWFEEVKIQQKLFDRAVEREQYEQVKRWVGLYKWNLKDLEEDYIKRRYELLQGAGLTEERMLEQEADNAYTALFMKVQYWSEVLKNETLNTDDRLEAEKEYVKALEELRELQFETDKYFADKTAELWDNTFAGLDSFAQSIQTVTNAMSSLIQQEISEGKISEAQAKKKRKQLEMLEKVSLAANLFQIAGSTASGIMGIWNAYALEKVANAQTAAATGPAAFATLAALNAKSLTSAIINTTAMATVGLANMAAATMGTISKLSQFKEESSASVSTPNMAMIDSSVYSYRETEQDTPENDELNNRPIVVLVKDIEDGLNMRKVRVTESSW